MSVKCIALGNVIMRDDSIGIRIARALMPRLEKVGIEVIIGETDIGYACGTIEEGDFIIVIDAAFFGNEPGTISINRLGTDSCGRAGCTLSQHQPNLIDLLKLEGKLVEGYVVGIEIERIEFGLELSPCLKEKFAHICEEIYGEICNIFIEVDSQPSKMQR